jgi:hypothetical protein
MNSAQNLLSWILGSHSGEHEEYCLPVCEAVYFGENSAFRRKIPLPSSGSNCKQSKRPLEADGKASLTYSSTLKMEAIFSYEAWGLCPSRDSNQLSQEYKSRALALRLPSQ